LVRRLVTTSNRVRFPQAPHRYRVDVVGAPAPEASTGADGESAVEALATGTIFRVMSKYQGQIAPKNLLTGPSYDKVDINLAQQIPLYGRAKLTALFSMENFLNFLNLVSSNLYLLEAHLSYPPEARTRRA